MKSIPTGRLYYSISEVSDMIGVKPHVLRYWETQFKMLRPKKGRGGARMFDGCRRLRHGRLGLTR